MRHGANVSLKVNSSQETIITVVVMGKNRSGQSSLGFIAAALDKNDTS